MTTPTDNPAPLTQNTEENHSAEIVPIRTPSAASVVLEMSLVWGTPMAVTQARLARMDFEDLL